MDEATQTATPPPLGREVWAVVLARFVSSTGAEAAFFLGLWGKAAFVFDGTPTDLAILSALVGVASVIGSLIGGVAVDRFDARRVVLAAETVFVPATLLLILADDIPSLLAVGVISWLTGSVLETAITSLPPAVAHPERLDQANARLESANWAALILGPAVGAPLVAWRGVDTVFVLDAATSLIALGLLARLSLPVRSDDETAGDTEPAGNLAQTMAGLRYALTSVPIRTALYLGALVGVAFGMFVALEPLFFRDVVGVEVEVIGYVNAVFGAGLLAGSLLLDRFAARLTSFRSLLWLTAISGLGGMLYVSSPSLVVVVVGAVVWSVPLGAALPLMRTLAQRNASAAYTGRVMGALGTVTGGLTILPLVAAPSLAALLGVQGVLLASAAVAVIGAPLVIRTALRLDAAGHARPTIEAPGTATSVSSKAP